MRFLLSLIPLLFYSNSCFPTTITWDGEGSDYNWSTAENWVDDIAPSAGDDIVFSGSLRVAPTNDYANGTSFASITFDAAAASFTIDGNDIEISGGSSAISSATVENTNLNLNITFTTSAPTITASTTGYLIFAGTIDNGGYDLTVYSETVVRLNGVVSGTGGFKPEGAGLILLKESNTYSGGTFFTTASEGRLKVDNDNSLGTGNVTYETNDDSGAFIKLEDGVNIGNTLTLNSGYPGTSIGLISGPVPGLATWSGAIIQNYEIGSGGLFYGGNPTDGLIVDGSLTSTVSTLIQGANRVVYSNTITGYTNMQLSGEMVLANNDALCTDADLDLAYLIAGTLDLDSYNQTITGLNRSNNNTAVVTSSSGTPILTINNLSDDASFTGNITGSLGITKTGAYTQILTVSTSNTYSGITSIENGILEFGGASVITASRVVLDGGTLSTGSSIGYSSTTTGTLTLSSTSEVNLGSGSHSLTFAASDGTTWNGYLEIVGWYGSYDGSSGTSGQIFTGSSAELSASKLSRISFKHPISGLNYTATQLSTGEIVPTSTLPVQLITFEGEAKGTSNHLFWESASELNNQYYQILHSKNGLDFKLIGIIEGAGNSSEINTYTFIHSDTEQNVNYYKLVQFDFNGISKEFRTIVIKSDSSIDFLSLLPNQVESQCTLRIKNNLLGPLIIVIYNSIGTTCLQFSTNKATEEITIPLDFSSLNYGTYYLNIVNESLTNRSIKFYKI